MSLEWFWEIFLISDILLVSTTLLYTSWWRVAKICKPSFPLLGSKLTSRRFGTQGVYISIKKCLPPHPSMIQNYASVIFSGSYWKMTPFHLCQDEKDNMPEVVATDKELAVRSPGHASQEALEERGVRSYKDRREHINLFESMWVLLLLFV